MSSPLGNAHACLAAAVPLAGPHAPALRAAGGARPAGRAHTADGHAPDLHHTGHRPGRRLPEHRQPGGPARGAAPGRRRGDRAGQRRAGRQRPAELAAPLQRVGSAGGTGRPGGRRPRPDLRGRRHGHVLRRRLQRRGRQLRPGHGLSGSPGTTTGLYTLALQRTPGLPLQPDLAGTSFQLGQGTATWGATLPLSFGVDNRGGAASGASTSRCCSRPATSSPAPRR
jgi:hypothetical protein